MTGFYTFKNSKEIIFMRIDKTISVEKPFILTYQHYRKQYRVDCMELRLKNHFQVNQKIIDLYSRIYK